MEKSINTFQQEKLNISSLLNKLARSNDIESYNNNIMKYIEENNKQILVSIKEDKKSFLLITRTYYLNEFNKIEKYLNNEDLLKKNIKLTKETYLQLLSFLNLLFKFEDIYINKNDVFKSLQLQNKIVNIIKQYYINNID